MASQFFPLDPETIKDMPLHEIFITLPEIMRAFGLSWEELRTELAEGRLKAMGVKMGAEYRDIHVSADKLVAWMVLTGRDLVV